MVFKIRRNMGVVSYKSPFHVNHDEEIANKMLLKMDLSIFIKKLIKERGWTQIEAAKNLGIQQSRISQLMTHKIEKFSLDVFFDILDKLGFKLNSMQSKDLKSVTIELSEAS